MKFFIKDLIETGKSEDGHRYFLRFGKGDYRRRFLISLQKGKKIKVRGSFELANEFVNFAKENGETKFSGKILTRSKLEGKEGKKKAGGFVYEIEDSSLDGFDGAYFYLLDSNSENMVMKIKKKIPKPGKNANKIDDKFCLLELDLKYLEKVKERFFWDVPEGRKAIIEHELIITDIVMPEGEEDPVKIRALAKRKGKIIRTITVDGKETKKEVNFEC